MKDFFICFLLWVIFLEYFFSSSNPWRLAPSAPQKSRKSKVQVQIIFAKKHGVKSVKVSGMFYSIAKLMIFHLAPGTVGTAKITEILSSSPKYFLTKNTVPRVSKCQTSAYSFFSNSVDSGRCHRVSGPYNDDLLFYYY